MYYGTVVHAIERTMDKNASTYYSHDVLRVNTSAEPITRKQNLT